ncbi:MAG: response regulator [Alphaproteobacteria bacterium]|nr:response regulator [Alphaproteobacteria bacterium]
MVTTLPDSERTEVRAGDTVGPWRLHAPLGSGTFGTAWEAVGADGRRVAVKLLREAPGDEVRALASVSHPAVVGFVGAGTAPVPHIAMELAHGPSLDRAHPLDPATEVPALLGTLADALALLHAAGVAHGDVKPANVVLADSDPTRPFLVDFGTVGTSGGTPRYAAPERLRGALPSAAADVFALGRLARELLGTDDDDPRGWATLDDGNDAGPPWLLDLLDAMVVDDPLRRPSAAHVADRVRDRKVVLPIPGTETVLRRAGLVHAARTDEASVLDAWWAEGGVLVIAGGPGSGKSHLLRRIAIEGAARGMPVAWLDPATLADTPVLSGTIGLGDDVERWRKRHRDLLERWEDRLVVTVSDRGFLGSLHDAYLLELGPLSVEEVDAMFRGLLGASSLPADLPHLGRKAAGGSPRRLVAWLGEATRCGALCWQDGHWVLDRVAASAASIDVPQAEIPVDTAPTTVRKLASALALRRSGAPVPWIAAVTRLALRDADQALQWLEDRHMIVVDSQRVRWSDDATRLAWLPDPAEAEHLHARWLDVARSAAPDRPAAYAEHLLVAPPDLLADEAERCLTALAATDARAATQLGRAMIGRSTLPAVHLAVARMLTAVGAVDEALTLLDGLCHDAVASPSRARALLLRAHLLSGHRARHQDALDDIARARALDIAHLRPDLDVAEARVLRGAGLLDAALAVCSRISDAPVPADPTAVAHWLQMRGIHAQCLLQSRSAGAAAELLDAIGPDVGAGTRERALLDTIHARILFHAARLDEAAERFDAAAREESLLPALDRARLLNNAAAARYQGGDRDGARRRWQEALTIFSRLGAEIECVRVQTNLCVAWSESGRVEQAEQAGRWAATHAEALGEPELQAVATGNLCDLWLAEGDLREAEPWLDLTEALADTHRLAGEQVENARRRAELAVRRRADDALVTCLRAVDIASQHDDAVQAARSGALAAVCYARLADVAATDEALRQVVETLVRSGATGELADARLWAALAWSEVGEEERARDELDRAEVWAREVDHAPFLRRVRTLASQLGRATDQIRDARFRTLTTAMEAAHRADDLDTALQRLVDACRTMLDADRVALLLGPNLVETASAQRDAAPRSAAPRSIVRRCARLGREIVAPAIEERGDLGNAASLKHLRGGGALAIPLHDGPDVLGVLYVDGCLLDREELRPTMRGARAVAAHAAALVARDTLAHEREATQARLDAISHAADGLLGLVSHELRTPLHTILATAELLGRADERSAADAADGLRTIEDAARRLLGAVEDMLVVSDVAVRSRGTPENVDLGILGRDIVDRWARREVAADRHLHVDAPPMGDRLLSLPRRAVDDVVDRLIDNAMRHAAPGPVHVRFLADDGATLAVEVADRGPGLPASVRAPQTGAFAVDTTTVVARDAQGLGLGLAACRRLVAGLGGTLELVDRPGGGTLARFRIVAPTARPTDRRTLHGSASIPDRVLVVDDHPVNRRLLEQMVRSRGLMVDVVDGGLAACDAVARQHYLVVLMDCHMPGVDGVEATRRIRQLPGITGEIPIFAVTADTRPAFHAACRAAGMDEVLTKPVALASVSEALTSARALWFAATT